MKKKKEYMTQWDEMYFLIEYTYHIFINLLIE